jgi:hypothetical protein
MISKRNVKAASFLALSNEFNQLLAEAESRPVNSPEISDNGLNEYIDRMKAIRDEVSRRSGIESHKRRQPEGVVFEMTSAIGLQRRRLQPTKPVVEVVETSAVTKTPRPGSYAEEKQKIADAVASFPERFKLRAFGGDVFRVTPDHSYMNGEGIIQIYTERFCEDGEWKSFAKGTVEELRKEVVELIEEISTSKGVIVYEDDDTVIRETEAPIGSDEEWPQLADVAALFPGRFGMRSFAGDVFRVSSDSFTSNGDTFEADIQRLTEGEWESFVSLTVEELKAEVITTIDDLIAAYAKTMEVDTDTMIDFLTLRSDRGMRGRAEFFKWHARESSSSDDHADSRKDVTKTWNDHDRNVIENDDQFGHTSVTTTRDTYSAAVVSDEELTEPQTITVDAATWKSARFLIEGMAIMQTVKARHPDLHVNVVKLARCIESAVVPNDESKALTDAIAMLDKIAKGGNYDSLDFHQKLNAIKAAQTTGGAR